MRKLRLSETKGFTQGHINRCEEPHRDGVTEKFRLTVQCPSDTVQMTFSSFSFSSRRSTLLNSRATVLAPLCLLVGEVGLEPWRVNPRGLSGRVDHSCGGVGQEAPPAGPPRGRGHEAGNSQPSCPRTGPGRFQRPWQVQGTGSFSMKVYLESLASITTVLSLTLFLSVKGLRKK